MDKILVLEDDSVIHEELCRLLINNGFQIVNDLPCDLAILDINLPGENGYEICRKIRQTSNVPVIFLTAREKPEDELYGFAVGADDYIRKPYHSAVLLARINRHLKRNCKTVLRSKGLLLDLSVMSVSSNYDGRGKVLTVELSKNEARILACLMQKEVCTRNELIEDLWNNSMYVDENTLYVNMNRLRDKLKQLGREDLIKTIRGVGYRL